MNGRTVLISGAGIAGTSLAYWLRRHGFAPTVVERAPELRAGGYKVDIRGAALDVVDRMGILDAVRQRRTGVRSASVVNAVGRRVASMDGDTFGGRQHADAELLRGDLTQLLHDLTADAVEYRFNDAIAGLSQTGDGVSVTLESGQTRHFDLVIGADGLQSRTRQLAFDGNPAAIRELGYWVSIFSVPNHLGLDREELTYIGPGRTALVYSTAGADRARAMFLFASDGRARPRGRDAQLRLLAEAYGHEGWEIPRLLAEAPAAPDFYFDSLSQVDLPQWWRGRVGLLGDAAYAASPASGQGTSLALVGAYVLAGELAAATGDHEAGFTAYESAMRPFVAANQKLGPANIKRMVLRTAGQVRMSMRMLAVLNRLPGKDRLMAKVIEPIHRAANAITLKPYGTRD